MEPLIPPQTNALLQTVILAMLFASIGFKWKKKYLHHGVTTLAATVLNLSSFLLVMLPSLLRIEIIGTQPLHVVSIVTLLHASIGTVTVLLSIWLVIAWHFQSSSKDCFKRKILMRATFILWSLSLIMGFLLYAYLYTTFIP